MHWENDLFECPIYFSIEQWLRNGNSFKSCYFYKKYIVGPYLEQKQDSNALSPRQLQNAPKTFDAKNLETFIEQKLIKLLMQIMLLEHFWTCLNMFEHT